jgi:hypothetical protein
MSLIERGSRHPSEATQRQWLREAVAAAAFDDEGMTADEAYRMWELETFEWRQQQGIKPEREE